MQLWQDGLVAMLAAVGLASLMWAVVKTVLYGGQQERRQDVVALIPAQGDGEGLEQQVRLLERLRREQGALGIILLVDCGLTEAGTQTARLLAKENRWVALCRKDEIPGYLTA